MTQMLWRHCVDAPPKPETLESSRFWIRIRLCIKVGSGGGGGNSTSPPPLFPEGLKVNIFSVSALQKAISYTFIAI